MTYGEANLDLGRVRGTTGGRALLRARAGFSLTELIIVVGIIILFIAVAVPAFNLITGRQSIAGAQNILSAEVANVRMRAIGQQRPMGLLFVVDSAERVAIHRLELVDRANDYVLLDRVPEADPVLLPAGIGVQFVRAAGSPTGRYAGFIDGGKPVGRVMLFSASGRLDLTPFWFRANGTQLGQMLDLSSNTPPGGAGLTPEVGLVLFDRASFASQFNPADTGDEDAEEDWLDSNGTLLILSRYNGTFVQEGK